MGLSVWRKGDGGALNGDGAGSTFPSGRKGRTVCTELAWTLSAHFESVFAGPNGDYPAMMEALSGITAEQALWKPAPDCNSIWQIVDHQSASNDWQREVLEQGAADLAGWLQPAGGEDDWRASLARLGESHVRLLAVITRLTEAQLQTVPDPADGRTQWELLLSSAAHEAYHAGQIDYLKGLQAG